MKKLIKAYMLPTEDKSQLFTSKRDAKLHYHFKGNTPNNVKSYKHTYITISQEIEPIIEGDWFMQLAVDGTLLKQCNDSTELIACHSIGFKICRKIIATSDRSLLTEHDDTVPIPRRKSTGIYELSQSFLKAFVKSGGKEDWLCEYELVGNTEEKVFNTIKLDSDNCVILSAVEEKLKYQKYRDEDNVYFYELTLNSGSKCVVPKELGDYIHKLERKSTVENICTQTGRPCGFPCIDEKVCAVEEKMYSKDKFIESLHSYWDKMHGKGHQNINIINWIKENL
jgi:hypothetical protein